MCHGNSQWNATPADIDSLRVAIIIIIIINIMLLPPFPCSWVGLSVSSARLVRKLWMNFYEIFARDRPWIRFWMWSGYWISSLCLTSPNSALSVAECYFMTTRWRH